MNPILSIIIPCYNHGEYIQDAIDSIEYANDKYSIEIIIVNDGSTNSSTISKLNELESKGYKVINQDNKGLGNARNNGISTAKGKYILPLDSDNKVLNPYLNDAIDILEKDAYYDIVYGNAIYFGERSDDWIVGEYNLLKLVTANYIDACAVFRKSIWEKVGHYDEKIPKMGVEDWDFWLNSSFNGARFFYLQKPCFNYRVLKDSMIRSFSQNNRNEVREYIELKYHNYINASGIEYFYLKKITKNYHIISKYASFKIILKALFFKIFSKINVYIKK